MASVDSGTNNPNDPNNPNNAPGAVTPPGQTNQPATTAGAGGVTATGAGNVTGQVVGTANPSQPFQNISNYLSANAPQSKDLASQVAGTVSAPINEAQAGITNAAQNFTQSVNAGYTPENKDLITAVSNNPAATVAENPENVTNFLANLNDTYKGPTDFTQEPGYGDLQAKIASAQSKEANTQSEGGIQQLLQSVEGPTTAGINRLDSLLLSADPANYKTIQDSGTAAAALPGSLSQATTDQNALAQAGMTESQKAAQDALAAINQAHGTVSSNLTNEQNVIQGVVDEYNQSIGVINPVVQTITSAIRDFLAKNPNITFPAGTDPMAALENIANVAMPELSTYASPDDYAQIAALMQLGDKGVGNLPITSATANQAQTFNLPNHLMDAVGKAPGVEQALQDELTGFGSQINSAVKPFTDAETAAYNWAVYGEPAQAQEAQITKQIAGIQQQIAQMESDRRYSGNYGPQIDALKAQLPDLQSKLDSAKATVAQYPTASWDAVAPIAKGLQWVDPAETDYRSLVDAINAELGKLGSVGVPTLTYGPKTVTDPVTGLPIGKVGKDIGNAAAIGIGAGVPAATAAGLLTAAAPTTASELASSGATVAGEVAPSGLTGVQATGPAALAAYGTSNIVQNSVKNPIQSGLMSLANTGLSLATLSLPPQIFTSIGKDISKVINSIGDFFGGLF